MMINQVNPKKVGEKSAAVPLCPQQILYEATLNKTKLRSGEKPVSNHVTCDTPTIKTKIKSVLLILILT
jgi:hypothetical protein